MSNSFDHWIAYSLVGKPSKTWDKMKKSIAVSIGVWLSDSSGWIEFVDSGYKVCWYRLHPLTRAETNTIMNTSACHYPLESLKNDRLLGMTGESGPVAICQMDVKTGESITQPFQVKFDDNHLISFAVSPTEDRIAWFSAHEDQSWSSDWLRSKFEFGKQTKKKTDVWIGNIDGSSRRKIWND